jgi:hypothetical protein
MQAFICDLLGCKNILQVIRPQSLLFLERFANGHESREYAQLHPLIPGMGEVLQAIQDVSQIIQQQAKPLLLCLRSFATYLALRARKVLEDLVCNRHYSTESISSSLTDEDWRSSGSCYRRPAKRYRPVYMGLDNTDAKMEGREAGRCQKFYNSYGKTKFTGGVMALWCPHVVCLGFHIMPIAEGRNDVFSALFKYWDKAPKVVVYDFACQLSEYCMKREPEFFKDTLFVIDRMHASGHTGCSQSSFISHHEQTNPSLKTINSSAAECGNSGLGKIRKSTSYMTEEHAIWLCWAMIMVWNRTQRQKQEQINS